MVGMLGIRVLALTPGQPEKVPGIQRETERVPRARITGTPTN